VLERALLAARTDGNRFWILLSENSEVVFAHDDCYPEVWDTHEMESIGMKYKI
jgi:hypothetical protein